MKRFRRLAWVALVLAAPVVAFGQASGSQPVPPEMLAPNAEAQELFEALQRQPLTGDPLAGLPAEQTAPLDAIIAMLFRRGETVADWQRQGVNMQSVLAALPGGANAHMSEATTQFGPYRAYQGDLPVESLISRDWVLVGRHGERREGGTIGIQIGRISPKLILVTRHGAEELGNASCTLHSQTLLYADPAVPASQMDQVALTMTMRAVPAMDRQPTCVVAEESEPGLYRPRYFDREGRRLVGQDENGVSFRIVPRSPFPAAVTSSQP